MKRYEYVFVVLCYRNHNDLIEFTHNIPYYYKDYKIVVVNSFFDNITESNIKKAALDNDCDFISVENKGYGYGNNRGIEYCKAHYEYDFLIIANPDVLVKKNDFDMSDIKGKMAVIAPRINTLSGKYQNPYWVVNNPICEFLNYYGYKHKRRLIIYAGVAINKLIREVYVRGINLFGDKKARKICAAHGSYIIFSRQALERLGQVYDENMFLFAEEALLAHRLRQESIPLLYAGSIRILHKENGSIGLTSIDDDAEERKSIIYYYEKLH